MPLHITALFLLLSAGILIPYLMREISSPYGKRFDISPHGFITIALGVGGLSALFLTFLGPENVLLAGALALGIALSILHPVPAVCFFVALLFLRPWEFLVNNPLLKVLPRLMAAVTASTWVTGMLRTRRDTFVLNSSSILFAGLLGWLGLSSLFSITPGASLQRFIESFSPTSVLAFLILNSLRTERDLRAFSCAFVLSGVGIVTVAFYITYRDFTTGVSDFRLHSSGLWGNANDLGALAVLMLPITLLALRDRPRALSSTAIVLASMMFITALLWSQSRAAQGAVLIAGITYVVLSGGGIKLGLAIAPAVVVIAAVAAAMPQRDAADTEGSSESRYNYVIAGLRMAQARPLFGVGVGNYPYLYEQYTPAFIESGNRTAHSTWILMLSETGVVGLAVLWMLFGSVAKHAWRLRAIAPQYILSMITYGVVMSVLSHTYLFLPYVFMAFIVAASRSLGGERPRHKSTHASTCTKPVSHSTGARSTKAAAVTLVLFLTPSIAMGEEIRNLGVCVGVDKPDSDGLRATSESIVVRGSRGEVVTFLLKIEGSGCVPLHQTWEGVTSNPPPVALSFFDLPEIETQHPSFTGARVGTFLDPTVPLQAPMTLCITDPLRPHWLLGEVVIPRNAPAGRYTARITAGTRKATINIIVWPMVIPERPSLPAYAELTPWFLVLAHHGGWHKDEAKLARMYSAAMIEHRVIPLKSIIAPLKEIHDGPTQLLDLENTPTKSSSFNSVVLNTRPQWSYYDFPTVGANGTTPIDYTKSESYFSAIENTIPKTQRDGKAIVYLWDEPKKEALPDLLKLSQLVKRTSPSLKQLVTTPYHPLLKDTVDIFAPVMNQYDTAGYPPPAVYRDLQKRGRETWLYVSCMSHGCEALRDTQVPDMVIDRPSSSIRSIGWLSMRYSIDAFLYYSVNNGFQYAPKRDPWDNLWDFSGNGDGTLFYPGRPGEHGLSSHQPVASLRLKLWRESSFDAEYIKWMNELPSKPSWWVTEASAIAQSTTSWERQYSKYQALRDRAGEYLSGQRL